MKKRIAILIGGGSKLGPIFKYTEMPNSNAEVVTVVSFKDSSEGIELAKSKNIPTRFFRLKDYKTRNQTRADFENDLISYLDNFNPDLIVLAGWDYLVTSNFIKAFEGNVINLHPALLTDTFEQEVETSAGLRIPIFRGLDGIGEAWEANVPISGCTVHFVTEKMDAGPVIIKKEVKREKNETLESFSDKIHKAEDDILPKAIKFFCQEKLSIQDNKVNLKIK